MGLISISWLIPFPKAEVRKLQKIDQSSSEAIPLLHSRIKEV